MDITSGGHTEKIGTFIIKKGIPRVNGNDELNSGYTNSSYTNREGNRVHLAIDIVFNYNEYHSDDPSSSPVKAFYEDDQSIELPGAISEAWLRPKEIIYFPAYVKVKRTYGNNSVPLAATTICDNVVDVLINPDGEIDLKCSSIIGSEPIDNVTLKGIYIEKAQTYSNYSIGYQAKPITQ